MGKTCITVEENCKNNQIRANVKKFFDENAAKCLDSLIQADDPNISDIYDLKTEVTINTLKNYLDETDILILTANKYETNILHKKIYDELNEKKGKKRKIEKVEVPYLNGISYFYFFEWGQYRVVHIMARSTGSNTIGGSEDVIRFAFKFETFHPLAVVSFGICFGIDYQRQSLGDVIISEKVYSYGEGIKIKDDKVEIRDDNNFVVADSLFRSIKNLINLNIISEKNGEYFGNYITGEAVMSNEEFKQKLVRSVSTNSIMAGEMEGYGMFKECTYYGKKRGGIPCIIIKAICDWGAQKNKFLSTLDFYEQDDKTDNSDIEEIQNVYREVIRPYFVSLSKELRDDIDISVIEDMIKDSIQAYAAESAFYTCGKLFENNSYVFGKSMYKKAYDIVYNYKINQHSNSIFYDTLQKEIRRSNIYIEQNELDELIAKLIRKDVLTEYSKENKKAYRITI